MKGKWLLIAGVTAASILAMLYRARTAREPSWNPLDGIKLGLDLKGGVHLVIRVQTDDALKAELDEATSQVRLGLEQKHIKYGVVEPLPDPATGTYRVVLRGVAEEDLDSARKVFDAALPEFRREEVGSELVADLPSGKVAEIREDTVNQAYTTISERINVTGVAEPLVQRQGLQGSDRILVQLPGVENPEQVKAMIGRVALLELKLVHGAHRTREEALAAYQAQGGTASALPAGFELLEGSDDEGGTVYYVVDRIPVVSGRDLARAAVGQDRMGQPAVDFVLNPAGAKKFGDATSKNVGKQLAIVLDGQVRSAPVIRSKISDRGNIEGGFTLEEARTLSQVLRAGALPAKIQYLEERTVGPTLGSESITRGWVSGVVGLIAIAIAMLVYYRLAGLNAVICLLLNGVLLLGALAAIPATLTLPGIAGFILTLGMAIDANVLIFESIRESLRAGVAPKRAVEDGFSHAFSTIIDTHLTTMLAATALWLLGSQSIRGFGVTLLVGLAISLFTSYYVSKAMFDVTTLRREWKPGETLSI